MYVKLFDKILDSSIWMEADATRIAWITMLAAMDEDGFCQFASVANLAQRAVISRESAEVAVRVLESPDTNSSDPEHEGRRVERVPGAWMILNAKKYSAQAKREQMKEKTRQRVAKHRSRNADVTPCNTPVTPLDVDVDVVKPSPEASSGGKKSAKKKEPKPVDPRRVVFIADLKTHWDGLNPNGPAFAMDGSDGKNIDLFLAKWTKLTQPEWRKALRHRKESGNVIPAQAICKWVGNLLEYTSGTINEFHHLDNGGNGKANPTGPRQATKEDSFALRNSR